MSGSENNGYIAYLENLLAAEPDISESEQPARLDAIVVRVQNLLQESNYTPEIFTQESKLLQQAADEIRAGLIASVLPPHADAAEKPLLAKRTLSSAWIKPALIALAVLVYVLPTAFFLREGVPRHAAHVPENSEVVMEISISSLDLAKDAAVLQLLPDVGAGLGPDGQLTTDLTLDLESGIGVQSYTFKAHSPLTPWAVSVPIDSGDILDFPLDRYKMEIELSAKENGRPIKVSTYARLAPHGFNFIQSNDGVGEKIDSIFTISRAGTIIFMVLLSTASLIMVTFASVVVAWQVVSGDRKVEFSMMTWSAALLFIIPTVRNGLPGAAPAGALIDFLVFFWLQALSGLAAAALVFAWWRNKA